MDAHPFGIDFGGSGIKGAPVDLEAGDLLATGSRSRRRSPRLPRRWPTSSWSCSATSPTPPARSASPSPEWSGTAWSARLPTSTTRGSAPTPTPSSPRPRVATYTSSTMPTPPDWPRCGTARPRIEAAWSSSPPSAPESDRRSSTTACWSRTPSSATSRSTATTRRSSPPTRSGRTKDLSYPQWAKRLTTYYRTLEKLFSPDLIIVGGGVSKNADEFLHLVDIETEIVPAKLRNQAGIVGAALWAAEAGDEVPGPGSGG